MKLPQFLRLRHWRGVRFSLLSAVSLCWATFLAAAVPTTPQTAFFRANTLYTQGQYAEAVEAYEAVLQSGLASGNVYFNLGNAYFKAGQVGRAILSYERARRFLPSDPDLAANLGFARSLTGAEVCRPLLWQGLVFPLAHRVTTDQLARLTSAAYSPALRGFCCVPSVVAAAPVAPLRGLGSRRRPGSAHALAGPAATDERLAATRRGVQTRGHSGPF